MCGIIGYIGEQASAPILVRGLKRLEYRGYDSAGIVVLGGNSDFSRVRRQGNLANLEEAVDFQAMSATMGIGHTRWATHGAPSEANAHPHFDCTEKIAVVHNGIIENFHQLRAELMDRGHRFLSETDTEVLAHLIEEAYTGDLRAAVREALTAVDGSYALVAMATGSPREIVGARHDSPLILGLGANGFFVASDIPAVLDHTREVVVVENGELVRLTESGYEISTLGGDPIERQSLRIDWDVIAAEKGGYEDFMLKEIFEQPTAVMETIRGRITEDRRISLPNLDMSHEDLERVKKVVIIACGTSYHAGMLAKAYIETWAKIPVEVDCSSEFRYRDPILDEHTLVVAITQSGETADTLAGVKIAREKGAQVLAVTNVVGSTITREADGIIYTYAGPEIGVAATKTLIAQMTALALFGLSMAQVGGRTNHEFVEILSELERIPAKIEAVLERAEELGEWAEAYYKVDDFLFLGRSVSYAMAMEGALKLKEISYIHAEGYPGGEMKHGPIALISEGLPIVVLAPRDIVYDKIMGNIHEAKARGAVILAIASEGDDEISGQADRVFYIPRTLELLSPLLSVVPMQLLSYYVAKRRGCNVDQPRNLAKSVTVE